MYMDKLKGILQEEDYIRVSQKFNFERTKLTEQKKELEQKINQAELKLETKNTTKEEKELDNLIEEFLKLEKIDKIYLYRLINKIEIDKDKNIYIYFKVWRRTFSSVYGHNSATSVSYQCVTARARSHTGR